MFAKFAVRDGVFIAVAVLVWWLVADSSAGTGMWADFTGVVAGVLAVSIGASLLRSKGKREEGRGKLHITIRLLHGW